MNQLISAQEYSPNVLNLIPISDHTKRRLWRGSSNPTMTKATLKETMQFVSLEDIYPFEVDSLPKILCL